MRFPFCLARSLALLSLVLGCRIGADEVDYSADIQSLLARRCYSCHGPDQQEGSIRFDVRDSMLAEADSGEVPIVPGKADESELLRRVLSSDESEMMPPEGKRLSESEVELLRKWIDEGAEFEKHWAFQPISDPTLPEVEDGDWPQSGVDFFVLARLERAGLKPVEPASPRKLIRRVYLDVIGLPPSPETVDRLLTSWDEGSYSELVDQLLADPAFGERWARNWLDVVRYAETNSYERDGVKPNAWKYRDYVIRAMNSDKAYDQFIREQVAGDELDEVTDDSLTATGFYRLGIWDDEPADPKQALFDGYDDLVSTTSQGILGLTLNCARCHDHKIDPITQRDYYSMVAFIRDVPPYGTRGNQTGNNQLDLDPEAARLHTELRDLRRELEKRKREIEQQGIQQMSAPDQRATEGPERRKTLEEKLDKHLSEEVFQEYTDVREQLADLRKRERELPPRRTVLGLANCEPKPPETFVLTRGSPHAEAEPVEPAFPSLFGAPSPALPDLVDSGKTAGRRKVLADWLVSDQNWLASRVIVNRLWLHYFGRGIVRSPNNFGLMGDPPTHPQLIDHLASELIRNNWSLKETHRQILLSQTYQLSTRSYEEAELQDPNNNLFWKQNLRRLSAEQVRDSVLAVTGLLNEHKYGASIYPELSADVLASQSRPGSGWGHSSPAQRARRSVYIHIKRSLPVPMLQAFDFPETDISCEARFLTTQPGQALTMLNSDWMQSQAEALLRRVERESGSDIQAQAQRALELVLCRPADPAAVEELVQLAERLQEQHSLSDEAARKAICLVALNLNEFLFIE